MNKLNFLVLAVMLLLTLVALIVLPASVQVPIHWNTQFEADQFASKWIGVFVMPLAAIGTQALFFVIPKIDPGKNQKALQSMSLATLALLTLIHANILWAAYVGDLQLQSFVFFGCGMLLVVLGNVMAKTQVNAVIGIRTTWTLDSPVVWQKTHQLWGALLMFGSLIFTLVGIVNITLAIGLLFGWLMFCLIGATIYSQVISSKLS